MASKSADESLNINIAPFITRETLQYPPKPLEDGERIENDRILLPDAATLEMRAVKLDNGLNVVLIRDPDSQIAGCALNVGVGSHMNYDAETGTCIEGIAHFLEHMLFMGTEKFPDEAVYNEFINKHGGHTNAFTSSDATNYHFSISPDALEEALDMFAEFFKTPLFDESCVEREMQAVHSEHQKNLQNNARQTYQLIRELNTHDQHPAHYFMSGNLETLRDRPKEAGYSQINIIDEMKAFHKKYYSANIMHLAIVSNHSLDDLEKMAISMFSDIENTNVQVPRDNDFNKPPYVQNVNDLIHVPEKFNKQMILQVPSTETRSVVFSWALSAYNEQWFEMPFSYPSHVLGHEGPTSLLSALKREGLVTSLSAGASFVSCGSLYFSITVKVPEENVTWKAIERIGEMVFASLKLLQDEPISDEVVKEKDFLELLAFKNQTLPKDLDLALNVSCTQPSYRPEVIFANMFSYHQNDDRTKEVLDQFRADTCQLRVLAPEVGQLTEEEFKEEYFNAVKYVKAAIPAPVLDKWIGAGKKAAGAPTAKDLNIAIPEPNPYIPQDMEVRPAGPSPDYADISADLPADLSKGLRLYFKQDDLFRTPKGAAQLMLRSPELYKIYRDDSKTQAMLRMLATCLEEASNEDLYDALMAGFRLSYSVNGCLGFVARGYSDKLDTLLMKMLNNFFNADQHISENHFNTAKAKKIAGSNQMIQAEEPRSQTAKSIKSLLMPSDAFAWNYLPVYESITYEGLIEFAKNLKQVIGTLRADLVLGGNYTKEEAVAFARKVHDEIPLAKEDAALGKNGVLMQTFKEDIIVESMAANWGQTNSAVKVTIPFRAPSHRDGCYMQLLRTFYSQPFFDDLRTKQTLGYLVYGTMEVIHDLMGLSFVVQSAVVSPEETLRRIDQFFLDTRVEDMKKDEFESFRKSLTNLFKKKSPSLKTEISIAANEVAIERFQFDRKPKCIEFFEDDARCNFEDFKAWAQEYMALPRMIAISHGINFKPEMADTTAPEVDRPLNAALRVKGPPFDALNSYIAKLSHKDAALQAELKPKFEAKQAELSALPTAQPTAKTTYLIGTVDRKDI